MISGQFSVRRFLVVVGLLGAGLGGVLALERTVSNARKDAVRQAIRAGRTDGEDVRGWFSAEEFEQLQKEGAQARR